MVRFVEANSLREVDASQQILETRIGAQGVKPEISFLLRHVSVQATERYLARKQRIRSIVNDRIAGHVKGTAAATTDYEDGYIYLGWGILGQDRHWYLTLRP